MTTEPHPKPRPRTRSRRISACYRHPSEPVTGFCALCLRERLAGLEPSGEPSSSNSTSAFVPQLDSIGSVGSILRPELRRSKSVSVGKCGASSSEPRRFSCDVRGKNTLSHLFNVDDESKGLNREIKVESKSLGFSRIKELRSVNDNGEEVRVSDDILVQNVSFDCEIDEEDLKTMKEHIDLEWRSNKQKVRDFKDIAGSFRVAASVFSKKLQKWRQKPKIKKGSIRHGEVIDNNGGRIARETQSEVGEYGLGRRSCDTEPRFSLDANRISVDNLRLTFDEPRASWDGYLIARTIPRLTPMLSGVENMMLNRPEEQMHSIKEYEMTSGLSAHSNSDSSSSQRRSSFDRSSSIRSCSTKALGLEVDEAKLIANSKVSPAISDVFNGSKLVITEKELKDWHLSCLQDDHSKSMDLVYKDASVDALNGFKKFTKWRMVGNIWGFRNKLGNKKNESILGTVVGNPVTEACEEQGREVNGVYGVDKGISSVKLTHSSSSITSRNSSNMIGSDERMRSGLNTGDYAKKGIQDFVLERNKSRKYSPSNFDNGLSRFYLTPFRSSYMRSKSGKGRVKNSSSAIAGKVTVELN